MILAFFYEWFKRNAGLSTVDCIEQQGRSQLQGAESFGDADRDTGMQRRGRAWLCTLVLLLFVTITCSNVADMSDTCCSSNRSTLTHRMRPGDLNSFLAANMASFSIAVSQQPSLSSSGRTLSPQPHVKLLSPLRPCGQDASSFVSAYLVITGTETEDVASVRVNHSGFRGVELQGTSMIAATCGVARFTNLRVDRAGSYRLLFFSARALQDILGSTLSQNASTSTFSVVPGAARQLQVVTRPAGMAAGRVFLVQPQVAVVDVGGNRVADDGAPAVTAICFPRPVCEIGVPTVLADGSTQLVRRDAVIRKPVKGLVTYTEEAVLGIVSTIVGAAIRFSAAGVKTTTEVPISVGRTPYQLKIQQGAPEIVQSGEAIEIQLQVVSKLDQPFGWFAPGTDPARVTVSLVRRQFAYNTPAPLKGETTAVADLNGVVCIPEHALDRLLPPVRKFNASARARNNPNPPIGTFW